jgi:ParB-like chromosome segregation protein Spo0J
LPTKRKPKQNGTVNAGTSPVVERVPIDSITMDPSNVRKHDARNMDAITSSLQRFGAQWPLAVVDGDGIVRAGNGRIAAAKAMGWTEVPIVRTSLTGADAVAFAIADNRTSELAAWDDEALAKTLAALQNDESIDHTVTGFDDADIERIISDATGAGDPVIPAENGQIDEGAMAQTEHECPKCGFQW